ncbi:hypothetical protein [Streptomyces bacillaris]|uniref:hypothetical protein n=1 Tax=Streptomyces bacillaris TaxID=68179 RepID=UPI00345F16DA
MKQSIPIPQLDAALALVQLLQENPTLPVASWSVGEFALHGHLHDGGFGALGRYAGALGGSIRPGLDFVLDGRTLRSHRLYATWRDISVQVEVVLPVADRTAVTAIAPGRPVRDLRPGAAAARRMLLDRPPVEDPHDSPLHHSYALGRDLPEVRRPAGACSACGDLPEQWCPDCAACRKGCHGGGDGNPCTHPNARWGVSS